MNFEGLELNYLRIADKVRKELPLRWERLKEKGLQSFLENIVEDSSIRPMTVDPEYVKKIQEQEKVWGFFNKFLEWKTRLRSW